MRESINYAQYKSVCLEAWLHCENVLADIADNTWTGENRLKHICNECADMCLGLLYAFKQGSVNTSNIALLCVGLCEECAEACEKFYASALFRKCASACRECAEVIGNLVRL